MSEQTEQTSSTERPERPAAGLVMRGTADVAACEGDSCQIPTSPATEEPTTAG